MSAVWANARVACSDNPGVAKIGSEYPAGTNIRSEFLFLLLKSMKSATAFTLHIFAAIMMEQYDAFESLSLRN